MDDFFFAQDGSGDTGADLERLRVDLLGKDDEITTLKTELAQVRLQARSIRLEQGYKVLTTGDAGVSAAVMNKLGAALTPKEEWSAEMAMQTWPQLRAQPVGAVTPEEFVGHFEKLVSPNTSDNEFEASLGRMAQMATASVTDKHSKAAKQMTEAAEGRRRAACHLLFSALHRNTRLALRRVIHQAKRNYHNHVENAKMLKWLGDVRAVGADAAAIKRLQRELTESRRKGEQQVNRIQGLHDDLEAADQNTQAERFRVQHAQERVHHLQSVVTRLKQWTNTTPMSMKEYGEMRLLGRGDRFHAGFLFLEALLLQMRARHWSQLLRMWLGNMWAARCAMIEHSQAKASKMQSVAAVMKSVHVAIVQKEAAVKRMGQITRHLRHLLERRCIRHWLVGLHKGKAKGVLDSLRAAASQGELKNLHASLRDQQRIAKVREGMMNEYRYSQRTHRLHALFDNLDQEGHGHLDAEDFMELGEAMSRGEAQLEWTPQRNASIFTEMDTDNDGKVGKEEFVKYWRNMSGNAKDDAFEKIVIRFHTAAQHVRHSRVYEGKRKFHEARETAARQIDEAEEAMLAQIEEAKGEAREELDAVTDQAHRERHEAQVSTRLKSLFDMVDVDGNGFLSKEELSRIGESMGATKMEWKPPRSDDQEDYIEDCSPSSLITTYGHITLDSTPLYQDSSPPYGPDEPTIGDRFDGTIASLDRRPPNGPSKGMWDAGTDTIVPPALEAVAREAVLSELGSIMNQISIELFDPSDYAPEPVVTPESAYSQEWESKRTQQVTPGELFERMSSLEPSGRVGTDVFISFLRNLESKTGEKTFENRFSTAYKALRKQEEKAVHQEMASFKKSLGKSSLRILQKILRNAVERKYGRAMSMMKASFMKNNRFVQRQARLSALFETIDQDGKGYFNEEALLELGRAMGEQELTWTSERNAELFREMDTDFDGQVAKAEFLGYWQRVSQKSGEIGFEKGVSRFHKAAQTIRHNRNYSMEREIEEAKRVNEAANENIEAIREQIEALDREKQVLHIETEGLARHVEEAQREAERANRDAAAREAKAHADAHQEILRVNREAERAKGDAAAREANAKREATAREAKAQADAHEEVTRAQQAATEAKGNAAAREANAKREATARETKAQADAHQEILRAQQEASQLIGRVKEEANAQVEEFRAQREELRREMERQSYTAEVDVEKARHAFVRSSLHVLKGVLTTASQRSKAAAVHSMQWNLFQSYRAQVRESRLSALFDTLDQDGNGTLEEEEFLTIGKAMGEKRLEWTAERNYELFSEMNTNRDGIIDKEQFVGYWRRMSVGTPAEAFEKGMMRFHTAAQRIRHDKNAKSIGKSKSKAAMQHKSAKEISQVAAAQVLQMGGTREEAAEVAGVAIAHAHISQGMDMEEAARAAVEEVVRNGGSHAAQASAAAAAIEKGGGMPEEVAEAAALAAVSGGSTLEEAHAAAGKAAGAAVASQGGSVEQAAAAASEAAITAGATRQVAHEAAGKAAGAAVVSEGGSVESAAVAASRAALAAGASRQVAHAAAGEMAGAVVFSKGGSAEQAGIAAAVAVLAAGATRQAAQDAAGKAAGAVVASQGGSSMHVAEAASEAAVAAGATRQRAGMIAGVAKQDASQMRGASSMGFVSSRFHKVGLAAASSLIRSSFVADMSESQSHYAAIKILQLFIRDANNIRLARALYGIASGYTSQRLKLQAVEHHKRLVALLQEHRSL